ncbi:hypothetical protein DOTSEDRAFT_72133 [Dothistroma septosporum NZE10]|uniref:Uncharacterized protein n=1 Tax=Dothistroma septosporum (strain NZE10 / CBS 128990) TaxID=675120 RepID=N1PQ79_DOTSN|nr:hypothetical protein DOTSEDRAFT_72133 [Dothistroma septosporum NZE10]
MPWYIYQLCSTRRICHWIQTCFGTRFGDTNVLTLASQRRPPYRPISSRSCIGESLRSGLYNFLQKFGPEALKSGVLGPSCTKA